MRLTRNLTLLLIASASLIQGSFAGTPGRFIQKSLRSTGHERQYLVYTPSHLNSVPSPLLLAFHGARFDGAGFEQLANLSKVAEREGFLLVYPEGIDKRWNDGRKEISANEDDIAFVDDLLKALHVEFNTDPQRTYATGFSNGGLFAFRLACERTAHFAAIAPVGAIMGQALSKKCTPPLPISVLNIVGEKDPLMPFGGGQVTLPFVGGNLGAVLSTDETQAFWVRQNRCADPHPSFIRGLLGKDGTRIEKTAYLECTDRSQVTRLTVRGGGHTWPGGHQYMRQWIIGKTSQQLDASQAVWDFLKLFRRLE